MRDKLSVQARRGLAMGRMDSLAHGWAVNPIQRSRRTRDIHRAVQPRFRGALPSWMMERIMGNKTKEELWAGWVTAQNIVRFQEILKGETDEGRYRILAHLLADAFDKSKKTPQS